MDLPESDDLEQYRLRCTRWLTGHGPRGAADLLAAIPGDTAIDRYGAGGVVEALEAQVARLLGKPAAVFMPSGTMAQQIALRIHADRRGSRVVAFHPTCHLEIHEDKAYQRLHGLVGLTVGNARALMTLEDLRGIQERVAAVLFELPQREIGGQLPAWDDLCSQVAQARAMGAAVHLDGARLWESAPYYGRTLATVAALFDTVYVSFYKGLGALAGCCLAGEAEVIAEARLWRKRHGGTLFGLWPLAASALAALELRLPRMPQYVAHAGAIAESLRGAPGIEVIPQRPPTNMMRLHVHADDAALRRAACRIAREHGVYTWPRSAPGHGSSVRVLELTVGDATLAFTPAEAAGLVASLARGG